MNAIFDLIIEAHCVHIFFQNSTPSFENSVDHDWLAYMSVIGV